MTPRAFRNMALELPDVIESEHMSHPDFRVRGKVFATLGYPSDEFAAIMLTPQEQARFVREGSGTFAPVNGSWGLKGSTTVCLQTADSQLVKRALAAAWTHKSSGSRPPSGGKTKRRQPPRRGV